MVRAAVHVAQRHPELDQRFDDLLWSINERLVGREGLDLERNSGAWVGDLVQIAIDEANAVEKARAKLSDELE